MSGGLLVGAGCAAAFAVLGLLHHLGFGKPLAARGALSPYQLCAPLWFGGGGLLLLAAALPASALDRPWDLLLLVPAGLGLLGVLVGVVGVVWLPRALRPAWLREWVDRGRPQADVVRWRTWGRGTRW